MVRKRQNTELCTAAGISFLYEELLPKLIITTKPFCLFSCYTHSRVWEINTNTFHLINTNSLNDLYDTIRANCNSICNFLSLTMVTISCEIASPQKWDSGSLTQDRYLEEKTKLDKLWYSLWESTSWISVQRNPVL